MEVPVTRLKHTDIAIALITQALEVFDGGTPTGALEPRLDQIFEDGEAPDLITALAYLGASFVTAIARSTDDLTPEDILATIYPYVQEQ